MINIEDVYEQTKGLSVLFVEDDAGLRTWMVEVLEDFFHRVDSAIDGVDALEKFKRYYELKDSYYDLVISDIQMPRMDGVSLTAELYALRADQPIIILSAHTEVEYLLTLINFGVAQFITKPIQYQKMINALYKVCQKINSASNPPLKPSPIISINEDVVWGRRSLCDRRRTYIIPINEDVVWDKEKKMLFSNGADIALTKYEIHLMDILTLKFEQVCSSDEILNHFFLHDINISSENLRGMMMRLRKKLPANTLSSIYGLGYRLSSMQE
jgi:DNA-binding response OmpR family regulator